MKNKILFVAAILAIGSIVSCVSYGGHKYVNILVVDEFSQEVSGAFVSVSFDNRGGNVKKLTKNTDASGRVFFEGQTPYSVPIRVKKEGYYSSRLIADNLTEEVIDRTIILRRKKDPRPMFAKTERYPFPELNKNVGFDFSVGDWVVPFGKGAVVDVYFRAITSLTDRNNYSFDIGVSFPNEDDGVVLLEEDELVPHSDFSFPYLAPDSGYISKMSYSVRKENGKFTESLPITIFRTRTISADGKIVKARYTKLYPPISPYGLAKEPGLDLSYYHNPIENSRSMEFDLTRNLNEGGVRPGRRFRP